MAASEVAISLAIVRLHDLLSKPKDIITYQKLTDQISDSISNLHTILNTREHAKLNDDRNQETPEGEERLLRLARRAEQIAEVFLVKLFRHQMSKSQKGRFTMVFDLVRLFTEMNRARARKEMVKNFMREVRLLSSKPAPSRPPANEGMPENERASSPSSSKRNRENTRHRLESDIVGRDKYVRMLLALLINDVDSNLRVISVVGKRACGKTALVRSVFSRLEIKHHFDHRAWVHIPGHWSESDWTKNLLVDILKQTPLQDQPKDLENKQEEQLLEMFHKLLMDVRYLIVLDDLGEASLINDLLVPFVDSMMGSRVIVTTPNAETQKFADPWTPVLQLGPDLTDSECKELLLVSITGGSNSLDHYLELKMPIHKERILSKCNGSPPAISLLGGLLSAAGSNCEALIDRLGDHPTLDDIMSLSFDKLPSMMKVCVLYVALFPKEFEVPIRRLFRLWAAEGLLAEAADRSVPMLAAEDCFCELESRNLICVVRRKLDGSARSCRMPAFIHEFFHLKAKELILLQIQNSSDSVSVAKQSAQHQQKQAQNTATGHYGYKVQCLRSLALFNTRKQGTKVKIAVKWILLSVLDLEDVYKPVLPENFGNILCNLRYLGLRWTVLDFIPESVGNLLFLETLDLKHTNITKVTSSIWNAKNLQHLYLSEASFDKSIQRQFSSEKSLNTKLETLWGLFIETADSPMISVLKKLQSLKKLGITCRPEAVKPVTECLSELTSLESLRLRSRDLYGQPLQTLRLRSRDLFREPASLNLSDMRKANSLSNLYLLGSLRPAEDLRSVLPGNLKVLTLSMSECNSDLMQVLVGLNDLIILRLLARSYTGERLLCRKACFPKLRVLKLWMLQELGELIVEEGGMGNLEELEIRHCPNLRQVIGLDHINSLKSVSLTGVNEYLAKTVKVTNVPYRHRSNRRS